MQLPVTRPFKTRPQSGPASITIASGTNTFAGFFTDGSGNGGLSIVKAGNGILNISGGVGSSGGVVVNAGTLILSGGETTAPASQSTAAICKWQAGSRSASSMGPTSRLETRARARSASMVSPQQLVALTSGSPVGTPVVQNASATPATLTVKLNAAPNIYGGVIQDGAGGGALTLKKIGTSSLVLTGNNTFTGGVNISDGNLTVGNFGALNSSVPNSLTSSGSRYLHADAQRH